jgi:hypothetical protein
MRIGRSDGGIGLDTERARAVVTGSSCSSYSTSIFQPRQLRRSFLVLLMSSLYHCRALGCLAGSI